MNIKTIGYSAFIAGSLLLSGCSNDGDYTIIEEQIPDSLLVDDSPSILEGGQTNDISVVSTPKVLNDSWSSIMEKEGYNVKLNQNFFKRVVDFSREIKADPVDLTFIMFQESKFDPSKKSAGGYVGLIQMDKTSFNDCALKMFEFEKYKKDHPQEDITLLDYVDKSSNKDFKKPNIGKDKISFDEYRHLSPEKQFKYAEAYIKYRIHEKGLNGRKIPSNQLWALIHRPSDYDKSSELNGRARLLNAVKNGGKIGGEYVKGIKEISPIDYRRIVRLVH